MDDNSTGIPINNKNTLYFPNYQEYELNRLAPTVQLSMAIGAILLLGFGVLDSADNPEMTYKIIVIRLCSALPLFTIFLLSKFKNTLALMKKSIMFLGLLSFSSYTYLHTQIHEKIYYIAIAWIYYLLVFITLAPLYSKKYLTITLILGMTITFLTLYIFLPNQHDFLSRLFTRSIAAFLFALILAFKIKKSEFDNYQFEKIIHKQTLFDHLTQIYNRRGFYLWTQEHVVTKTKKYNCSIIMMDLDNFKDINDRYGHQFGDFVIKTTAKIIQSIVPAKSCLVRFGGEEFLITSLGQSQEDTHKLAEKIRQKIKSTNYQNKNQQTQITISIGISNSLQKFHSLDELISQADKNLYKAKQKGKNTTVDT